MGANLSRLIRATILNMSLRNTFEHFKQLLGIVDEPRIEQNPPSGNDQQNSEDRESWATLRAEFREENTKHDVYFSIYNNREEPIANGTVFLDTSVSPDSDIVAYGLNPRTGHTHGMRFRHRIDFEVLKSLFL